jgi:hypothetical protein
MTRPSEALTAEAEATQAALLALLGDLKTDLTPAKDLTETLASGVAKGAKDALSTAKAHPVATAAIGVGLAWLLLGRKVQSPADGWKEKAVAARDAAEARLEAARRMGEDVFKDGAKAATARLDDVGKLAQQKADIATDLAQDLAAAFRHGLEDLDTSAQALQIQKRAEEFSAVFSGSDAEGLSGTFAKGGDLARSHPAGTAALGVLAAAGLALAFPQGRKALGAAAPKAVSAALTPAAAELAKMLLAKAGEGLSASTAEQADTTEPASASAATPASEGRNVSKEVKRAAAKAAAKGLAKGATEAISPDLAQPTDPAPKRKRGKGKAKGLPRQTAASPNGLAPH